jgi:uncharacterized protein YwgA
MGRQIQIVLNEKDEAELLKILSGDHAEPKFIDRILKDKKTPKILDDLGKLSNNYEIPTRFFWSKKLKWKIYPSYHSKYEYYYVEPWNRK